MKEVKVKFINKQGKQISKSIPENLASLYLQQGWELVKETSKPTTPSTDWGKPKSNKQEIKQEEKEEKSFTDIETNVE